MQFRFRKYIEEDDKYELIGISEVEDYDRAFKMFDYMKTNECDFCLENNKSGVVESSNCDYYSVKNVSFVFNDWSISLEERLTPHIVVDIEESY